MNVSRGDIVLVPVRFSSGAGQKIRPVLVVQSDHNNIRLADTIVAIITSNIRRASREPTQLLIDIASSDGAQSGLLHPSAVTCERLHTILQSDIQRKIGSLPPTMMQRIGDCLKASLGLT
jgi:mRNA interferase MazF